MEDAQTRLLVVAPDGLARMLLESHLGGLGHGVVVAADAVGALGAVEAGGLDLVLDAAFAGAPGSVAAVLSEAGVTLPVVVLARAGAEDEARGAGAAEVLTLPAARPEVAAAVARALTRARAARLAGFEASTHPRWHEATLPDRGAPAPCPVVPARRAPAIGGALPARIGRYVVRALLGRGGYGNVYRCLDPNLDRLVAVKTIRRDSSGNAEAASRTADRFRVEAAASARLVHPGIVATYDFGLDEDRDELFLAMELVEGPSLRARLGAGPWPLEDALRVGWQMADALAHAHARDVVHRDVKPENVLLGEGGRVKITDFGLARIGAGSLGSGVVAGTPSYMAPEQVLAGDVDARTDQFALGAVLQELVTGQRCFPGEDVAARLHAVLSSAPPRLAELGVSAPARLQEAFDRMLAKELTDRYGDDEELLAVLVEVGAELGIALRRA